MNGWDEVELGDMCAHALCQFDASIGRTGVDINDGIAATDRGVQSATQSFTLISADNHNSEVAHVRFMLP